MATDRNNMRFGIGTHLVGVGTNPEGVGRMKLVEVTSTGDYFTANSPALTPQRLTALFKAMIDLDSASEPAFMVDYSETVTSGTELFTANTVPSDPLNIIKRYIGKQANGRPCWRLTMDRA